jgi:Zn-dependent protease
MRDITLFIFGGAAQISEEPRSAGNEFLMALAGPATSLVIAAFFGLLWLVSLPASPPLHALAGWLAWINVGLALFNMIPGFPLDGGRVFRAIVWAVTGNLRRATQIATGLGWVVAYGFIFWGSGMIGHFAHPAVG